MRLQHLMRLADIFSSRYDHQTRLLPYVLHAIADDAEVSW